MAAPPAGAAGACVVGFGACVVGLGAWVVGFGAGLDFVVDPANREVVEALLVANIRDMTPALAKRSYELLLADKGGMTRDVALDMDGIRTVLQLRSKYGTPKKILDDPTKYVDLTYYQKAFGAR